MSFRWRRAQFFQKQPHLAVEHRVHFPSPTFECLCAALSHSRNIAPHRLGRESWFAAIAEPLHKFLTSSASSLCGLGTSMPDAPLLSARAPSGASVACYLISDDGVTSGWIVGEDAGDRAGRPGSIREAGARPVCALANFLKCALPHTSRRFHEPFYRLIILVSFRAGLSRAGGCECGVRGY
jgi:hypothetical protein